MENENRPIIIIGAARSGTNMLRDIMCAQPGYATWPCDEINYIWRYGNTRYPYDEFSPDMASPVVKKYIRKQFRWVERKYGVAHVVEKTCANSLRVDYVKEIFPHALFINIIRDGRDAASSALKRWKAPLDIPYLLKKARFVPFKDLFYYAGRYVGTHIHRLLFSSDKSLSIWGPKFAGFEKLVQDLSLLEVCAVQWLKSVELSTAALSAHPQPGNRLCVKYEDFVSAPATKMKEIYEYFNLSFDEAVLEESCRNVRTASVGKYKQDLDAGQQETLENLLQHKLKELGY